MNCMCTHSRKGTQWSRKSSEWEIGGRNPKTKKIIRKSLRSTHNHQTDAKFYAFSLISIGRKIVSKFVCELSVVALCFRKQTKLKNQKIEWKSNVQQNRVVKGIDWCAQKTRDTKDRKKHQHQHQKQHRTREKKTQTKKKKTKTHHQQITTDQILLGAVYCIYRPLAT